MNVFQDIPFETIMQVAIALVVIIAILLSIAYIIWGGFLMVVSSGAEEKIKKAINHIRHAIIGIVFVLSVLFVFPTILTLIGFSYGDYVKPQAIFETISSISERIFGETSTPILVPSQEQTLPINFSDI